MREFFVFLTRCRKENTINFFQAAVEIANNQLIDILMQNTDEAVGSHELLDNRVPARPQLSPSPPRYQRAYVDDSAPLAGKATDDILYWFLWKC